MVISMDFVLNIKTFVVVLMGFSTLYVSAQTMDPTTIPSPNAASLGRFGNVPVSPFTGQVNLSIPLYTLNVRGLEMPIELCYNSTGVNLSSLPSWTGHGWDLRVGGVITRRIKCRPDEYHSSIGRLESQRIPYFRDQSYCQKFLEHHGDFTLQDQRNLAMYDTQPDEFSFNFFGKTGKFYLDQHGQWCVKSESGNFEILYDPSRETLLDNIFSGTPTNSLEEPQTIAGFRIRDEQGYVYEFGFTQDAIDYSVDFFNYDVDCEEHYYSYDMFWQADSWYLTRVLDKFGNVLYTLAYEHGKFQSQLYYSGGMYNGQYVASKKGIMGNFLGVDFQVGGGSFPLCPLQGRLLLPSYLTSISTSNGLSVRFVSEDTISLRNDLLYPAYYSQGRYNEIEKNVLSTCKPNYIFNTFTPREFFYYLEDNDDKQVVACQYRNKGEKNNPLRRCCGRVLTRMVVGPRNSSGAFSIDLDYDFTGRMHLRRIEKGANGSSMVWSLAYNNMDKLPSNYLCKETDHWGYYNGKGALFEGIDTQFSKEKAADANYCLYGMLKKITYPTGGETFFVFEPNDYSSVVSLNREKMEVKYGIGGGVRVREIYDVTDPQNSSVTNRRTYSYLHPQTQQSSGELYAQPIYYWANWHPTNNNDLTMNFYRYTSIIPLTSSFGPIVGYSYVTERDGLGNMTEYHYSNMSSSMDRRSFYEVSNEHPSPYDDYTSMDFKRGKLLEQTFRDGRQRILESKTFKYRIDIDNMGQMRILTSNLNSFPVGSGASIYYGGMHYIYYPKYDVVEEIHTLYDTEKKIPMVTSKKYLRRDTILNSNYGFKHQVKIRILKQMIENRGDFSSESRYCYDGGHANALYACLLNDMFCIVPVSEVYLRNGTRCYKDTTMYKSIECNRSIFVVPFRELRYRYPLVSVDTLITYHTYTATGAVSSYRKLGAPKVYLYWTKNDNNLFSQSYVPVEKDVNPGIPEEDVCDYIASHPRANITAYRYDVFNNIIGVHKPNGDMRRYTYDPFGRLLAVYNRDDEDMMHFRYHYQK